ncbi:MAG: sigma-70 family RNA polymerase sigma factor [Bacteroidales bacterium]|nr:sigma-70 family RNA polymerase sigma factor [Bacteroidales bacterium]
MNALFTQNEVEDSGIILNRKKSIEAEIGEIYDRHYIEIFRFVYSRVDDKETAADLVSTTFLKALKNADKFTSRHSGALKSWIFTIANNEVLLHFRKQKVQTKYYVEMEKIKQWSQEENFSDDMMALLIECMEQLPDQEYELIQWKYFDRLSFTDIASITGKTEESLRTALFRIRKKIGTQMITISKSRGLEILLALTILLIAF